MALKREGGRGGLRTGRDASQTGAPAQSGPNRGTNTGSATPGGVGGSKKAGARQSGGSKSSAAGGRKGPVTIPGAGRGAQTISGVSVAGVAKKGG